jgi:hypothetical protein
MPTADANGNPAPENPNNDPSFVQANTGFGNLEFTGFEHLVGSNAKDSFTVQLSDSTHEGFGSNLLVRGGTVSPGSGIDNLVIKGTGNNDKFSMLHRTQVWPGVTAPVAGVKVDGHPRVLYNLIENIDLQGGVGNDTFTVDPGSKLPQFPKPRQPNPNPLYGDEMQSLTLVGGADVDRFEVVPDRPGNKFPLLPTYFQGTALQRPGVTINVYGDTTTPATDIKHDQLFLYRLAARIKANFPNGDAKPSGPRSHTLWLWFLGYAPVNYFDMWRVTASIANTPAPSLP